MINSLMKKIVNLSWNLLNQQSLHLICLSDTDQHSHFTISVHQQCTGRTPKLRCHFNVNKPDSDWQAGPITATTGWHKRRQSNSHLDFQLSNSANDQWAIESWWGTATVQVRGDESGWVQLTMHLERLTWFILRVRKALWFCYAMHICAGGKKRGLILSLHILAFSIFIEICRVLEYASTCL